MNRKFFQMVETGSLMLQCLWCQIFVDLKLRETIHSLVKAMASSHSFLCFNFPIRNSLHILPTRFVSKRVLILALATVPSWTWMNQYPKMMRTATWLTWDSVLSQRVLKADLSEVCQKIWDLDLRVLTVWETIHHRQKNSDLQWATWEVNYMTYILNLIIEYKKRKRIIE